jgi:acyl-CoA thioester hydrolase
MDTDAAGIWHHATAIRWTEEAEAELHRRLGIVKETFGATPRVHLEFDFKFPLYFDDEVDITLTVATVGETSLRYEATVDRDGDRAVSGQLVIALIDRGTGETRPWPPHMRKLLEESDPSEDNVSAI